MRPRIAVRQVSRLQAQESLPARKFLAHSGRMLQHLLRQLLPGTCLMCDGAIPAESALDLCRFCLDALPWNDTACQRCAEPLPEAAADAVPHTLMCERCRSEPPPFIRTLAPLKYQDAPRAWVGRLKDQLGMVEGHILGTLLADAAARCYRQARDGTLRVPDLLVPVPLTARRLAWRGHNQALTLARPVARKLGIPLSKRAVLRVRPGARQRGLGRSERLHNLDGIFVARHRWHEPICIGIVDDVMTTGSTAAELCRVLLAAGAGEVHVLCATRTPRRRPSMASILHTGVSNPVRVVGG